MRARLIAVAALVAGSLMVASTPSHAGHHLWRLTQLYSNADGSTQFAELFVGDNNESGVGPFTLTASGHTFSFVTNLPSVNTANTWILLGTANLASLPGGIAPDYIIPAGFFSTGGGAANYAGVDVWNYGTLPTDGVRSLMRDGTTKANLPHNFSGQVGGLVGAAAASVPAATTWSLAILIGALLLVASGLLRRRRTFQGGSSAA